MNGTAAMNKVLHTALQALFIIASACVLTALIIAGALNEAMRPWSGAFFLMLVPYYLILVKKRLDREQAGEMARSCTWSMAAAASLFLLLIGMLLLLNSIPGGGEFVRLLLFKPLDFLKAAGAAHAVPAAVHCGMYFGGACLRHPCAISLLPPSLTFCTLSFFHVHTPSLPRPPSAPGTGRAGFLPPL